MSSLYIHISQTCMQDKSLFRYSPNVISRPSACYHYAKKWEN